MIRDDMKLAHESVWKRSKSGIETILVLLVILIAIAVFAHFIGSVVFNRIIIKMFINLILVLGLQVFMGNSDILWFPHVGFMGIGAYASVIFSMSPLQKMISLRELYPILSELHLCFVPALIVGAIISALIAGIVGVALMRLNDFPAVIAGFALLIVIHVILLQWTPITNGPQSLFGVERETYLLQGVTWACLILVVAYLFKESNIGLKLRASRDDLISSASIGVNITLMRWTSFVLSAFIAGIGGGLYAHFITSFTANAFFLNQMFLILAMLVIGGPRTITGAVLGTILVTCVYQSFRWLENFLGSSHIFDFDFVGLTEIMLSIAMILILY